MPASAARRGADAALCCRCRRRCRSIAANRARMLELGIPSLVKELQGAAAAAARKPAKKQARREAAPRAPRGAAAPEQPTRRSSRLQDAAEHPKPAPETAEQRFERQLGGGAQGWVPAVGRMGRAVAPSPCAAVAGAVKQKLPSCQPSCPACSLPLGRVHCGGSVPALRQGG